MQEFLKHDSKLVLLLRAAFLKLASIMNFPLVRIIEADSNDFASVSGYYSGELVRFVRNVLQIVPVSVFNILDNIIKIFSKGFKEMPLKILKADLKDYSQLDDRYELSKSTHQISLYTKAILMMEKTFMGVIQVDPKNILEDGIRKELLHLLANTFHKSFDFSNIGNNNTSSSQPLQLKLVELSKIITSIKTSFCYIQDYINIDGSRIWYEEMHRLIDYYVFIEANTFLSKKIKMDSKYDFQMYQIPRFPVNPKEPDSVTFLGKLIRHIVSITRSKSAVYYPSTLSWYDLNSKETIGIKTINMIKQCLGVEGIQGLYKLISYMNVYQISNIKKTYNRCASDKNYIKHIKAVITVMKNPYIIEYCEADVNKNILSAISNLSITFSNHFLQTILNIGQFEILRHLITHCLKESVEVESSILHSQISNLNNLNLYMIKNQKELKFKEVVVESKDVSASTSVKLTDKDYYRELCNILENFGMVKSIDTFYLDLSKLTHLSMILSIIAFNEMINTFIYDRKTGCVYKKNKNDDFEFFYFLYGLFIILKQMGKNHLILFLSFSTFLIKNNLTNQFTMKKKDNLEKNVEVPNNLIMLQLFIQEFSNTFNINDKLIEIILHPYINFKSFLND